jgi:RNA polymerase sigma-70 factor (ECF subfamily)
MENRNATDKSLIEGIRNDSSVAYHQLFVRYYQSLCQYVMSFTTNHEDAEDIVQELFLYLWQWRAKIEITESVPAYLYRMAKNRTLNHIRKETHYRTFIESMDEAPLFEENRELETREFRTALHDCIDSLPARSKEILLLDRIKGLKQAEIASQLNISAKTVRNQIWNALQRLRTCLEQKEIQVP